MLPDAIHPDSGLPTALFQPNGRLRPPVVELLQAAFGFQEKGLTRTVWVPYTRPRVWAVAKAARIPQKVAGLVWGRSVIHDKGLMGGEDGPRRSLRRWFSFMTHEQSHRDEVYREGWLRFYTTYLRDATRHSYLSIPTEVRAFKYDRGPAWADQLWTYREGLVRHLLLDDHVDKAERRKSLASIGAEFRQRILS